MSNATIIERMRETCDRLAAGEAAPMSLGRQLVALAEALEAVPRTVVERAREFELQLVVAQHHLDYGEAGLAQAATQAAVEDVRAWLDESNLG